ncbi:MAG: hypothetical protein H7X95_03490 [Deltaproteobacteria bacterium]|nr:hypothetical protein [Deltaproteobacteria bacterium]
MSTPNVLPGMPIARATRPQAETANDVIVATTRPRQTARTPSPFRDVLRGGVGLLVRGATVATSVVAGPVMAAAVREAGAGATGALVSSPPAGRSSLTGGAAGGGVGAAGSSTVGSLVASGGGDQGDLATAHSMQRESQAFNLQLLELQEEVQQENRRFTTVSNVLRAKHDTAKAALSNIRS